ncbi:MAG: ATP-dependent Clp protease ATP-binding subunit [Leptolyngbya sp.]|nr:ATP-dependent Clp protease ATP-binding subunit [Candidatus Melainabacteria bacterium]
MKPFGNLNDAAARVLLKAQEEASAENQAEVRPEHLLMGLFLQERNTVALVLRSRDVTHAQLREQIIIQVRPGQSRRTFNPALSTATTSLLARAAELTRGQGRSQITVEDLSLCLIELPGIRTVLTRLGIDVNTLRGRITDGAGTGKNRDGALAFAGSSSGGEQRTPTLDEMGDDLTREAREHKLDPVVGRQKELQRTIQILGRRTKNNVILIGEPGVGKTAIANGLAQMIVDDPLVPEYLQNVKVISLNIGNLLAGTKYRGEFEGRIKSILAEVKKSKNILLVIDEIHTLVGAGAAGGGADAANLLKPALARGDLRCIGMTDLKSFQKYFEKDAALERRFQPILVPPATAEESIQILYGLRPLLENHYAVTITDGAVVESVRLSDRYISDRFLPDKAIDAIEEACSAVSLRKNGKSKSSFSKELTELRKRKANAVRTEEYETAKQLKIDEAALLSSIKMLGVDMSASEVTGEDAAQVVSAWSGVPLNRLTATESARSLLMQDEIHRSVIGQTDAVKAACKAIQRARVGLKDPKRPIASLMFTGPTGVGKTELAKALARYMFDSEEAIIRVDMSEYMEKHSLSRLIGSPPGYVGYDEGGLLTEAVRRRPYSIVLFDEIEKAHPDVFNLFLQILEDGRLTDSQGRTVDFKNTLVIMTSNIAAQAITKGGSTMGFEFGAPENRAEANYQKIKQQVTDALKAVYRPEFLNRLDEVVVFRQLVKQEIRLVADIMLTEVYRRVKDLGMSLIVTAAATDYLVDIGYNPAYGARPLRRAIQSWLEDPLAEQILSGHFAEGSCIFADLGETNEKGETSVRLEAVECKEDSGEDSKGEKQKAA